MFFGVREIRELLKSIYRDKVKIPLVLDIRRQLDGTKDAKLIGERFCQELGATRFLGMGNPSESGTHLLYFFRQENQLPKELFIHSHEVLSIKREADEKAIITFKDENIKRYVFLDDVCGSGTQAAEYSQYLISEMKRLDPNVEVSYYTLFSTTKGLEYVREHTLFDTVDCVFELDESFKCFSDDSRYFQNEDLLPISKKFTQDFCMKYGINSFGNDHALGYKNGQMLMGFAHNIPDNTLPIIWSERLGWKPIFRRYSKLTANFY
jgi:hypothetical protein